MPVPFQLQRLALKYAELSQDMDFETRNQGDLRKTRQEHQNRLHCSLPTAEQDAERPAWRRSAPPRGRGRERCGLHWNESSARAGAFLGGAIQVLAIAILSGYAGGLEFVEWASVSFPTAWGYLQTGLTYLKYALMVYDVASLSMDGHVYTMLQLAFSEKLSLLGVPLFGWKALAFALDRIYDEYERRL